MTGFSDHSMQCIQSLFTFCNHILEEEVSGEALLEMQETLKELQLQASEYKQQLQDQEENSKSGESRCMAALLRKEQAQLEELIRSEFPKDGSEHPRDLNVGALYVEYLSGRAMQSIREALIGAIQLKLLSREAANGNTEGAQAF